jgi:hypothetical protein
MIPLFNPSLKLLNMIKSSRVRIDHKDPLMQSC